MKQLAQKTHQPNIQLMRIFPRTQSRIRQGPSVSKHIVYCVSINLIHMPNMVFSGQRFHFPRTFSPFLSPETFTDFKSLDFQELLIPINSVICTIVEGMCQLPQNLKLPCAVPYLTAFLMISLNFKEDIWSDFSMNLTDSIDSDCNLLVLIYFCLVQSEFLTWSFVN